MKLELKENQIEREVKHSSSTEYTLQVDTTLQIENKEGKRFVVAEDAEGNLTLKEEKPK